MSGKRGHLVSASFALWRRPVWTTEPQQGPACVSVGREEVEIGGQSFRGGPRTPKHAGSDGGLPLRPWLGMDTWLPSSQLRSPPFSKAATRAPDTCHCPSAQHTHRSSQGCSCAEEDSDLGCQGSCCGVQIPQTEPGKREAEEGSPGCRPPSVLSLTLSGQCSPHGGLPCLSLIPSLLEGVMTPGAGDVWARGLSTPSQASLPGCRRLRSPRSSASCVIYLRRKESTSGDGDNQSWGDDSAAPAGPQKTKPGPWVALWAAAPGRACGWYQVSVYYSVVRPALLLCLNYSACVSTPDSGSCQTGSLLGLLWVSHLSHTPSLSLLRTLISFSGGRHPGEDSHASSGRPLLRYVAR